VKSISVTELAALLASSSTASASSTAASPPIVLDVREPWEFEHARLLESVHIPLGQITSRIEELDDDRQIICLCHHGVRSAQVVRFLQSRGFTEVYNLSGGIDAWSREVDPTVPIY
jgi:rhodanese-related sulfurtransferase